MRARCLTGLIRCGTAAGCLPANGRRARAPRADERPERRARRCHDSLKYEAPTGVSDDRQHYVIITDRCSMKIIIRRIVAR